MSSTSQSGKTPLFYWFDGTFSKNEAIGCDLRPLNLKSRWIHHPFLASNEVDEGPYTQAISETKRKTASEPSNLTQHPRGC
jgi:hypothetical protein